LFSKKTILVCPLDWGLGHATRCVPLIRELENSNEIIIGITPVTSIIFNQEFPHLKKINIPPYNISYSSTLPLWLKLFFDSFRIKKIISEEKKFLEEAITKHKIEVVISDNRFGLHTTRIPTVFVTHQLFLKSPVANSIAQSINKKYISKFKEVWVPDYPETSKNLSGELSHGEHFHPDVKYIGPVSRLHKIDVPKKYDHLFLLSGPQPQLGILKGLLLDKVKHYPQFKFALVSPDKTENSFSNLEIFHSPNEKQLSEIICSSKNIICRSGYSTLMDLYTLEKKEMTLIPTPGQTEQEYLAKYWEERFGAKIFSQEKIAGIKL
jgi:uncharacterized protein (TIGR00661 family)